MIVRFVRPRFVIGAGQFNVGEIAAFPDAAARHLCDAGIAEPIPAQPPPEEIRPMITALDRPPAHKMLTRAERRKGGRHVQ